MKSIFFGLSLVSVATAQVVNGISMVTASGPSPTTPPSPSNSGSSSTVPSSTANSAVSTAPPSQYTPAPSSSTSIYQTMPYESYMNGGYKSLACGYGYTKSADGHCQPESWVFLLSRLIETSSLIPFFFAVYFPGGGLLRDCYHKQYVRNMFVVFRFTFTPLLQ
jgi:hypothetical protein